MENIKWNSIEDELQFYIENEDRLFEGQEEQEEISYISKYSFTCEKCNSERIILDNNLVCTSCGECLPANGFIISYGESTRQMKSYFYKRMTHFSSWLKTLQGMNYISIPPEDAVKIKETMGEQEPNIKSLKKILTQLKLKKYYKYRYYVLNKLFGVEVLKISQSVDATFKYLFEQIQYPYKKFNKKRKNFLSYNYILAKFAIMTGHTELLPYLTQLKSKVRLEEHDVIWKKICNELHWEIL